MSEYTISLAFSVWHHYLKQLTEKHQISLPIFPEQLKKVDISYFLPKAEKIVLGKLPEIHQGRKTLPCSKGDLNNKEADIYYKYQPLYLLEKIEENVCDYKRYYFSSSLRISFFSSSKSIPFSSVARSGVQ